MSHTLTIKAFFFNAKTDYLPYYKNFTISLDGDHTAEDLLASIQIQNFDFNYPKEKLIFKINNFILEGQTSIASIVDSLGTTLTIDPANSYRANHGLEINDDDFMHSFSLLAPYASDEDLEYYQSLYALHYASETEKFSHDYIGDAILVLAYKMIKDGNPNKNAILDAVTSPDTGLLSCEYENNLLTNNHYGEDIEALKALLNNTDDEYPSLMDMIKSRFCKEKAPKEITRTLRSTKYIDDLDNKHIAYYSGNGKNKTNIISQMIKDIHTKEITFSRKNKLLGLSLLETNKTLALKKAGTTLLEAYDAGAEVLIFEDENAYDMCEENFSSIEKIMGRKIIGLELLLSKDFITQASRVEV
ncbi:hypothetical protein MNB_SV-13-825 [hydrothermal vent metagenome]|uniref:DUF5644 domain-containing protein n=1 Tax=hydrothermal vent metagenome TaxID=652676 RepID=A0A1W1D144_9ZZZZ